VLWGCGVISVIQRNSCQLSGTGEFGQFSYCRGKDCDFEHQEDVTATKTRTDNVLSFNTNCLECLNAGTLKLYRSRAQVKFELISSYGPDQAQNANLEVEGSWGHRASVKPYTAPANVRVTSS
jgi:hypothetical protein